MHSGCMKNGERGGGESKKEENGEGGGGVEETLASKPLDFEKPIRPRTGFLIHGSYKLTELLFMTRTFPALLLSPLNAVTQPL